MISFILNNQVVKTGLPSGSTLLDFVRYEKQLVGTKIGCREGDCGACNVLVGTLVGEEITYQTMTSCLTPLSNVHAKHVLTVEGINLSNRQLSPVQELMIVNNGTQCGFCTIGFVMSLTGVVLSKENPTYANVIKAIDGNICRCTGYKSIERAAKGLCETLAERPAKKPLSWLVEQGFVPDYLQNIPAKLQSLQQKLNQDSTFNDNGQKTDFFIGGGTDLMVQKPAIIRTSSTTNFLDDTQLKGIHIEGNLCRVGASTTVTEFEDSPEIQKMFPDLSKYLKLVSSTPIRNMATMGGNIINASPIGDMTIFFLALNSQVILKDALTQNSRTLPLKDLFLDYKKLDKTDTEYIESLQFEVPDNATYFNFEKVSKRTHLDIASVNSACQLKVAKDGAILQAHISAGGVAAIPKYLDKSSAFLKGKKMDDATWKTFSEVLDSEVSPISDARGSAAYKRLLLRQLVLAHFVEFKLNHWLAF